MVGVLVVLVVSTYFREVAVDAFCQGLAHSPRLGGFTLMGNPVLRLDSLRNSSSTLSRTRLLRRGFSVSGGWGGGSLLPAPGPGVIAVACEMIRLGETSLAERFSWWPEPRMHGCNVHHVQSG